MTTFLVAIVLMACLPYLSYGQEKIAIYRWSHGNDWVEARADEQANFEKWGYGNKTLVGYLFKEPVDGSVAISRWVNLKTNDWMTVREDESTATEGKGYTSKVLLGYAYPTPRSNTMPINRWLLPATGDWVTVPESASADMQKWGYTNKTLVAYTPN